MTPHIDLAVSFDIEAATLRGTAKITIPPGLPINFGLIGLKVTGLLLNQVDRENIQLSYETNKQLSVPLHSHTQTLFISYEKRVDGRHLNSISDDSIVLGSGWHPVPDQRATYTLEARVPVGFTAISESDFFPGNRHSGAIHFAFSQPVYSLTFVAAPYQVKKRQVRPGLHIYTLFFDEEKELAEGYLDSAAAYINRYEESIGPFPYNHYAIVENIKPTGFGLPTFTLLGQQVIRLPFIRRTSLGHEILHSWFGNSIDIGDHSANWCEGLTTYLADLSYRDDAGEGVQARKETIQNYLNYVKETTQPLKYFYGVGHDRMTNRAGRAVGYGRSAMLFHELNRLIGTEIFWQSIRRFSREFRGKPASWANLRSIFEQESGSSLDSFFDQRLGSIELPNLKVTSFDTRQGAEKIHFSFTLVQEQSEPFDLPLTFIVKTISGSSRFFRRISTARTDIRLELDSRPLEIIVDPEYDIMRRLAVEERTPAWSSILGAEHGTMVLGREEDREIFNAFIERGERDSWHVATAENIPMDELSDHHIIFLGTSSDHARALFADPRHPGNGLTVDVRFNPLDRDRTIALISTSSGAESEAVINRLSHYGKYSFLHFEAGRITEKSIAPSINGLRVELQEKPAGLATSSLTDFDQLVEQLSPYRVVYIGEKHTSRADHLLQSMLIEALYIKNPDLVIGMEMFPRSSQQSLDDYITDPSIRESRFLKDSDYYQVWGYDFRLFRPIFAFARKNQIPVIGLNIEREIVSSLFKTGTTNELTPEQRASIPRDRKLDMEGYPGRLAATLAGHDDAIQSHGTLGGFIQAQALWDESMADSIYRYLQENPSAKMVVLAGSQHTRKDSGIPPRVSRRMDVSQATISNLATSSLGSSHLSKTTDYLFLLEADDFPPPGKIGVVLQQSEMTGRDGMVIIEINPKSDAINKGVMVKDILVNLDSWNIESMEDVRAALMERSVGETVSITIMRKTEKSLYEELQVDVKLFDPSATSPHP